MPGKEEELNLDRLRGISEAMIKAITNPAYVEAMRAVRSAPEEQRLVEGSRRLAPDGLRAQGVELPDDMRITSRYFEPGIPTSIDFGDQLDGPNVINRLNDIEPGVLDRVRVADPALFDTLVRPRVDDLASGFRPDVVSWGACACGGGLTFCGGAGGST